MARKALFSTVLAAAMGLTSLVPAAAMPVQKNIATPEAVEIDKTQGFDIFMNRRIPGGQLVPPGYYRPGPGVVGGIPPGYYLRGGIPYYNGYRGHPRWRKGWRRHNGWWFPAAAFAVGVIVGSGSHYYRERDYYRDPPRRYRSGSLPGEHYIWCDRRFRTYRAYDNTYVPKRGYRAQCRSPYWP